MDENCFENQFIFWSASYLVHSSELPPKYTLYQFIELTKLGAKQLLVLSVPHLCNRLVKDEIMNPCIEANYLQQSLHKSKQPELLRRGSRSSFLSYESTTEGLLRENPFRLLYCTTNQPLFCILALAHLIPWACISAA